MREGEGWEKMHCTCVSEGGGEVAELDKCKGIIAIINFTGIQSMRVCHFPMPDNCITAR